MHKRTAHRWRLTAIMMAGIVFALGSFWLVQLANRGNTGVGANALRNDPDYIVERFSVVRMTPDGQPRYIISGNRLTHRPVGDISDVETPVVQNLAPGQPPMTIVARQARIDHARNVVDLSGNVDVERVGSTTADPMSLKTDALTIFPDEDRMETKQPVVLMVGSTTVTGTGMRANNATSQVDILSKMQLSYPPRAR
jgi:lipopolysaccharide export system protein LptC